MRLDALSFRPWLAGVLMLVTAIAAAGVITLDGGERRRLDTFFSNFSEAHMESFTPASLTDRALLDFALAHCYLNKLKELKPSADRTSVLVPAAMVDRTTEKYFGRTLGAHHGAPYAVPVADGDPISFSQVRSLKPYGEAGLYRATGVIYTPGGPGVVDVHGSPASWKKAGEEVAETGRFTATIERVRGDGGERWVLREYRLE